VGYFSSEKKSLQNEKSYEVENFTASLNASVGSPRCHIPFPKIR